MCSKIYNAPTNLHFIYYVNLFHLNRVNSMLVLFFHHLLQTQTHNTQQWWVEFSSQLFLILKPKVGSSKQWNSLSAKKGCNMQFYICNVCVYLIIQFKARSAVLVLNPVFQIFLSSHVIFFRFACDLNPATLLLFAHLLFQVVVGLKLVLQGPGERFSNQLSFGGQLTVLVSSFEREHITNDCKKIFTKFASSTNFCIL